MIVVITAMFNAASASASAKTHDNPKEPCVQVVGHLPFESARRTKMFVRQSARGKRYLYVLPDEGRKVIVVNISDPDHPALEVQFVNETPAHTQDVIPVGLNAAIVEVANHDVAGQVEPTALRTIGVMDLSDPAHPKMACRFAGVSGYLADDSKSLIYIVNAEGLWIVRHREPPDISLEAWEKFAAAP